MTDWQDLIRKETAAVGLVSRNSAVVIGDPTLTSVQAERLVRQVAKGRESVSIVIEKMMVADVGPNVILNAIKLRDIWDGLEEAAVARLEIIRKLEAAAPEGSG